MIVSKTVEFDAGHRVARHGSQCANPHGHRYAVTLTVSGAVVDDGGVEHGMVIDFGALKKFLVTEVHDRFDHGFIVEVSDTLMLKALMVSPGWKVAVIDSTPTAENLAELIGVLAQARFAGRLTVVSVAVRETPTSVATWMP